MIQNRREAAMKWAAIISLVIFAGCLATGTPTRDTLVDRDSVQMHAQIAYALMTLDDNPDIQNSIYTPSVSRLEEIGEPALDPLLPYLLSNNSVTREHAGTAIGLIVMKMYGFVRSQGWSSPEGEGEFHKQYQKLWGDTKVSLSPRDRSPEECSRFIENTKLWLASRRTN